MEHWFQETNKYISYTYTCTVPSLNLLLDMFLFSLEDMYKNSKNLIQFTSFIHPNSWLFLNYRRQFQKKILFFIFTAFAILLFFCFLLRFSQLKVSVLQIFQKWWKSICIVTWLYWSLMYGVEDCWVYRNCGKKQTNKKNPGLLILTEAHYVHTLPRWILRERGSFNCQPSCLSAAGGIRGRLLCYPSSWGWSRASSLSYTGT